MKKLIIITLVALGSVNFCMGEITKNATKKELSNFDKGENFEQCLKNCRRHHRSGLSVPRGYGKGLCFDECSKEHKN